jgi:hypothetical protein
MGGAMCEGAPAIAVGGIGGIGGIGSIGGIAPGLGTM